MFERLDKNKLEVKFRVEKQMVYFHAPQLINQPKNMFDD